jgi:CO/xanthine dehydrogenase Mo-binding subunit
MSALSRIALSFSHTIVMWTSVRYNAWDFADYLIPTAREVPRIETIYRQTPSPLNPLGVKGVGEVGTIPAAAAIASAVEDALSPSRSGSRRCPYSRTGCASLSQAPS